MCYLVQQNVQQMETGTRESRGRMEQMRGMWLKQNNIILVRALEHSLAAHTHLHIMFG